MHVHSATISPQISPDLPSLGQADACPLRDRARGGLPHGRPLCSSRDARCIHCTLRGQSRPISANLSQSLSIGPEGSPQSRPISVYLGISRHISAYLGISRASP